MNNSDILDDYSFLKYQDDLFILKKRIKMVEENIQTLNILLNRRMVILEKYFNIYNKILIKKKDKLIKYKEEEQNYENVLLSNQTLYIPIEIDDIKYYISTFIDPCY